ncbi:MAG: Asp-tRNA(Asn)/Glu-tRNA(Gln) amidotransferase subunit GatB [Planctomycetia bacterium]|nr:Asp-tRNA(Asn)/Glu-tRNA(Gln) amidotransferase subunit GatB [Planctomycetia bacterium]
MADLPYRIVIGLEVHVQLLTRTKLFCGCRTDFGQPPNSATCPVCIGMPGVLPVMNRRAFDLALKAATALNCELVSFTKWDRKNYYYPDLPKNYQISQYDLPFSKDGWLDIQPAGGPRRIGIIRVHLEEDAGKSLHDESGGGGSSRVDLNRTGTPLLEIVSQPDMAAPEEARAYVEELRLLLRELEISDCEMQEGSLRCDANVNIHIPQSDGSFLATPLIEVKNLNSIRGIERALKYEADRQYDEFQKKFGKDWRAQGQPKAFERLHRVVDKIEEAKDGRWKEVAKATAGWDDARGVTNVQRRKEEAADYRYFPEPDLVPVLVDDDWRAQVREGLGELPAAQRGRLQAQYGLAPYDAGVLAAQGRAFVAYFEALAKDCDDANEAKNWLTNDVLQTLHERKLGIREFALTTAALAELIREVKATGLNKQRAREVYAEMLASGTTAKQAVGKLGIQVVADEGQLLAIIRKAIEANPKAVADFKKGKVKAADAIKGAVMRETKGQAKAELLQQLLMQELQKA